MNKESSKATILAIDVGNTSSKMAVFADSAYIYFERFEKLNVAILRDWIKKYNVHAVCYSASGADNEDVLNFIKKLQHNIILSHDTNMPIQIAYTTPATLGKDRIAAMLGAQAIYPHENVVVIDLGTCITYDILTSEGVYLGGNIAPGIQMRLRSMHDYTARLPLVDLEPITHWIGQSTVEAIRNGAILGTQMEIESFIGRVKTFLGPDPTKLDDVQLILTGGDGEFMYRALQEHLENKLILEPYLILKGLNAVMEYNLQ